MPITNDILARNLAVAIRKVYVQTGHAESVGTRARTGYYKMAVYSMASVVEALLHYVIQLETSTDPSLLSRVTDTKFKPVHVIKASRLSVFGATEDLTIGKYVKYDFKLSKHTMLDKMNEFCFATGLIDARLHKEIIYIRNKRNEIHLQGLSSTKRNFTKAMVDRTAAVADNLYALIEAT